MKFEICRLDSSPYFSENFSLKEKNLLKSFPSLIYLQGPEQLTGQYPIILISNTHSSPQKISRSLWENVCLIIHPNSGYDNFTLEFVKEIPCPIIIGHEIRAQAVVEYILSALFRHFTSLPEEKKWSPIRTWPRLLLKDQQFFFMGFGVIGQLLHQVLSPLVKNISLYDPFKGHSQLPKFPVDVVILCAGLNPTSEYFISKNFLDSLSPHYLLINTARGKLIKEKDLMESLEKNPHAFAYLDVFEDEPQDFSHYTHLSNIHFTSHIAGVYQRLEEDILAFENKVISDFIQDYPLEEKFLQTYHHKNLKNRLSDTFII